MIYSDQREKHRQFFCECWRKYLQKIILSPLEQQVVDVIIEHPEYHMLLADEESAQSREYHPSQGETNPFLHMAMHLALRDQVRTNKPSGIADVYQQLLKQHDNAHDLEHAMMDCLAEQLWLAQRDKVMPDEQAYLLSLKGLVTGAVSI